MYRFGVFSGWLFLAALIAVLTAVLAWKRRQERFSARALFWLETAIAVWAVAGAFEAAARTASLKLFWSQIAYLGTTTTPVLYFITASLFCRLVRPSFSRRAVGLMLLFPAVSCLATFTNAWHGWIWPEIVIQADTGLAVYHRGWWWWLLLAHGYGYIAASIIVLLWTYPRMPLLTRTHIGVLLAGALFPVAGNLVYVFGDNPVPGFDWTLAGFVASGVLVGWGLTRLQLFGLSPLARDFVFDQMGDGLLVVDSRGRALDANRAFRAMACRADAFGVGLPADRFLEPLGVSMDGLLNRGAGGLDGHDRSKGRDYRVHASPVAGGDGDTQYVVILRDRTELLRLQSEKASLDKQVHEARREIEMLSRLLPICSKCKRIRDNDGDWYRTETYLRRHADLRFTHGYCPLCMQEALGSSTPRDDDPRVHGEKVVD